LKYSRIYKVRLENNTLDQYDKTLSSCKEWVSTLRDIKLSSLLENKRIQFDIENINLYGFFYEHLPYNIGKECFITKKMSFILKDNSVEELSVEISPLNNEMGNTLSSLLKVDMLLEIRQMFIGKYVYFYIDLPKNEKSSF
jgi:hypothetical protein